MEITKMIPGYYRDVYELWLSCKGMGLKISMTANRA